MGQYASGSGKQNFRNDRPEHRGGRLQSRKKTCPGSPRQRRRRLVRPPAHLWEPAARTLGVVSAA